MTRRNRIVPAVVAIVAATGAVAFVVGYPFYAEVERRRLDVGMASQADRGLFLFQMINGHLPTGSRIAKGIPLEKGYSWLVEILPYMEAATLYNHIDFHESWDSAANAEVRSYKVATNSSDPQIWAFRFDQNADASAANPIVGITGLGADAATFPLEDRRAGVFGYGRQTRLADITDGLSTTMMVVTSEHLTGLWMAGGSATVQGLDPARKPYIGSSGQFGRRGGASVLFADGSVCWIADSVNADLFESMATIHGRESTPELATIPVASPSRRAEYE